MLRFTPHGQKAPSSKSRDDVCPCRFLCRPAADGRLLNRAPWTQFFDLKGLPAPKRTLNDITLRNISGEYRTLGTLRGDPLRDITLENVDVKLADERLVPGPGESRVLKTSS
ncbi:MAG: hypothetical protein EXS42_05510 [Lacunisphaera sp.]|nr:hypothetical protein [Lacunisphaera sp.]